MTDHGVVYFSSLDWDFRKQDHQFIAASFAERGRPVLFIENTGARFPGRRDLRRVAARLRNWSVPKSGRAQPIPRGIEVVAPLCLPGASGRAERWLNAVLLHAQLRGGLSRTRRPRTVMWVALPTWAAVDLARRIRPDVLVYYCGDAFTKLPGLRRGMAESEREIARSADVVFATSRALADHCRDIGAAPRLVPVAIDLSPERAVPPDASPPAELRGIRGRAIGYMGGLNYKVDKSLIDAVAERFPGDTLVILGSVEDAAFAPRPAGNVMVLGERPYDEIRRYLARFDVCLIPYRANDYTAGVSPAKLLEYLAAGRPVVSTPLPEVLPFADVVRIAGTTEGFLGAIAESLSETDGPATRDLRLRRAQEHDMERVADGLIAVVEERLAGA